MIVMFRSCFDRTFGIVLWCRAKGEVECGFLGCLQTMEEELKKECFLFKS